MREALNGLHEAIIYQSFLPYTVQSAITLMCKSYIFFEGNLPTFFLLSTASLYLGYKAQLFLEKKFPQNDPLTKFFKSSAMQWLLVIAEELIEYGRRDPAQKMNRFYLWSYYTAVEGVKAAAVGTHLHFHFQR